MPDTTTDFLKGTLDLMVLKTLSWAPAHGYGIARWIEQCTSDVLQVEEGSLYPALHRMERRGLIRREDCATDSRGAEIVLTDAGAHAFRRASAPHLRDIREVFVDALTPEQITAAGEVARALRAHLARAR